MFLCNPIQTRSLALGGVARWLTLGIAACVYVEAHVAGPAAAATGQDVLITGGASVIDGDTLRVDGHTIRIHGIDAPEQGQLCNRPDGGNWPCGRAATVRMGQLTADVSLACQSIENDRYGRVVAKCRAGSRDLGEALVGEGMAWAFRRYSEDYMAVETIAQADGIGIWQTETQTAWDYRKAPQVDSSERPSAADCLIKGNISSTGERIYHMPWSPAYSRTKINTSNGERWFCSEEEAREAGWRATR